jgi:hypothetical protein
VPTIGTVSVPVTTLDRLIARHGPPEHLKIDVEGYELEAVRGLSAAVRVISFEANLPTFRAETVGVLERVVQLSPGARFNFRPHDGPALALPELVDWVGAVEAAEAAETLDVFAFSDV